VTEAEELITKNLWEAPENYGGTLYDDHVIIATRHKNKSIVEKSNYKTLLKEMPLICITVRFKHWKHGEVEMILLPLREADPTEIEWAAETISDLEENFVFDKDDYKAIEEQVLREFWRFLPESERYVILQAADMDPAACERECRPNAPLWSNPRVQEALRSYHEFTLEEEEGALINFDDDIATDSGPWEQSRLL